VANLEGDVWLTGGRWVANLQGDRWLNGGRWVAKLVAHLLATAALWVRMQTFSKIQNGRHKAKNTPATKHNILTIPGQPLTSPSDLCSTDLKIQYNERPDITAIGERLKCPMWFPDTSQNSS
jgi:hypothetical protein